MRPSKVSAAKSEIVDVAVHAALTMPDPVMIGLSDVRDAPYNPRTISLDKMIALKASIAKHGMVSTLVVQRKSEAYGDLVLIAGHQRARAMRELCAERKIQEPKVSAIVLDIDDRTAKQLNVSLNNIEGDFDPYKLGELFADIRSAMTMDDVLATGFVVNEIDQMILLTQPPTELADDSPRMGAEDLAEFAHSITLSVEFNTVDERSEAKAMLLEASRIEGRKAGSVLLEALKASKLVKGRKK